MNRCRDFRAEWLHLAEGAGDHAQHCAQCAAWIRGAAASARVLANLSRSPAPPELERLVRQDLEQRGDLERLLANLARHDAPEALGERVEAVLLGALDARPAPPVLERLVDEELRAPAAHRVERFSGSLERLDAPASLLEKVESRVRRRVVLRRVLGPLATLTAAGLLLWIAVGRGDQRRPREYSFDVVHASTLEELEPMARSLAYSLGGLTGGAR